MWLLDKILGKKEKLICQYCKEEIKTPSFVLVRGEIISNTRNPNVFTCGEQAFNYAQRIVVHSTCWIKMLREYGSPLYDMGKVYEKKKREHEKKKKK